MALQAVIAPTSVRMSVCEFMDSLTLRELSVLLSLPGFQKLISRHVIGQGCPNCTSFVPVLKRAACYSVPVDEEEEIRRSAKAKYNAFLGQR